MTRWFRMPLWVAAIFTGSKSFVANPIIGSRRLNKLGLHVARVYLANKIMRFRMWTLSWKVSKADRLQYQKYGFIKKTNFLPEDVYLALVDEIKNSNAEVRQCIQGDAKTRRMLLTPEALEKMNVTKQVLENREFKNLMQYTAGHLRMPIFHAERVMNGEEDTNPDPQTSLHVDTFHPTMKFWLYLESVSEINGPFIYVPGSNQLTSKRLAWEHQMSQQAKTNANPYTSKGSFRVLPQEADELGLEKPQTFNVPGNTLLIANTFGIHARGASKAGSSRLALWGSSRTNPFSPFPGLGFKFFNKLQYRVLNKNRLKADMQANQKGQRSSWHLLENDESW